MKYSKNALILCFASLITSTTLLNAAQAPAMPAPKADVYVVPQAQDLAISLKYPAEIKAYKKVQVVSRVLGTLEKQYFTEGSSVKQGDVLYKIEDGIYKAKYDAALATLNMNQAILDNASRNWDRIKKLYAQQAISEEKKDSALATYEQALAALALAKAQLRQAQIDLDYTNVKAPISGFTSLKQVDVGDLVTANPPTTLVEITQNDKVYVEFSMPLKDYQNIKSGLWQMPKNNSQVSIEQDGKTSALQGVIDFINVNIDKETSVVKMRATIDNKEGQLMAGNFARVLLSDIVQKNVITIPQKAVLQNPLGTVVFVEEQGRVGVRPVMLGKESNDKYVVAGGPLKSGDKVFINNFFRLKPGEEVVVDKTVNEQGK